MEETVSSLSDSPRSLLSSRHISSWADAVEEDEDERESEDEVESQHFTDPSDEEGEDAELKSLYNKMKGFRLFVGQLPKTLDEEGCRQLLEEYGKITSISIIRDKKTGEHRGCAFVTFETKEGADSAIQTLHNKKVLPPARRPVQVKYADSENEIQTKCEDGDSSDFKLFVGMVPKTAEEEDLRDVFDSYGELEYITILRGPNNAPKGCAFVKYKYKDSALKAIEDLNGNYKMEGSSVHLVVKFADTEEQKSSRKQKLNGDRSSSPVNFTNSQSNSLRPQSPNFTNFRPQSPNFNNQSQSPNLRPQSPSLRSQSPNFRSSSPIFTNRSQSPGFKRFGSPKNSPRSQSPNLSRSPGKYYEASGQISGPEDCNLFIYDLPPEFGDEDLKNAFDPFGNVLSAKVFIDKITNQSKCFGFVSYDDPEDAKEAILKMNGKQIGQKSLQVRLK